MLQILKEGNELGLEILKKKFVDVRSKLSEKVLQELLKDGILVD